MNSIGITIIVFIGIIIIAIVFYLLRNQYTVKGNIKRLTHKNVSKRFMAVQWLVNNGDSRIINPLLEFSERIQPNFAQHPSLFKTYNQLSYWDELFPAIAEKLSEFEVSHDRKVEFYIKNLMKADSSVDLNKLFRSLESMINRKELSNSDTKKILNTYLDLLGKRYVGLSCNKKILKILNATESERIDSYIRILPDIEAMKYLGKNKIVAVVPYLKEIILNPSLAGFHQETVKTLCELSIPNSEIASIYLQLLAKAEFSNEAIRFILKFGNSDHISKAIKILEDKLKLIPEYVEEEIWDYDSPTSYDSWPGEPKLQGTRMVLNKHFGVVKDAIDLLESKKSLQN